MYGLHESMTSTRRDVRRRIREASQQPLMAITSAIRVSPMTSGHSAPKRRASTLSVSLLRALKRRIDEIVAPVPYA